jgi:hypothetical protein
VKDLTGRFDSQSILLPCLSLQHAARLCNGIYAGIENSLSDLHSQQGKQLIPMLRKYGGTEICWQSRCSIGPEASGCKAHDGYGLALLHDPRQPDQIILEVPQRGYCRGDRVFRPAKVIVNDLNHSPGARHAG